MDVLAPQLRHEAVDIGRPVLAITPIRRSIVMVKASSGSDNVTALLNVGSGAVAFAVGFPTGMKPASVAAADLNGDCKPLPLDEAIQALKRDPTHPVRVRVDEELTVEVRAVGEETPSKTIGDLLREIGPWEGETGADLDALFTRQPGNRRVPDLP